MKVIKNIFVPTMILLFSFPLAAQTWTKQKTDSLAWLRGIYFFDEKRGFVVGGNGTFLQTANGGETWTKFKSPTEDNLRDIVFTDEKTGWLLCEKNQFRLKPGDVRSYILKTTDGGANWEKTTFIGGNGSEFLTRLIFFDSKTGFVTGEAGTLFRLQNDGKTFSKILLETRFLLFGGAFADAKNSVILGAGKTVLLTADGGESWREANIFDKENAKLYAGQFVTKTLGWAVGGNGKIFVTLDGGKNWRTQKSGVTNDLFDVKFTSNAEGWIIGDKSAILHTKNAGATWRKLETKSNHSLEKIFFINSKTGWAVGFGGTILKLSAD